MEKSPGKNHSGSESSLFRGIFLLSRSNRGEKIVKEKPMIRPIIHDPFFLSQKSEPATEADAQVITDLLDTLRDHLDSCVGMAANMIGIRKRIIVICKGSRQMVMVNPRITAGFGQYETEEGCLSLSGVRKTIRFRKITVEFLDQNFRRHTGSYDGYQAQIIQHEIDHCDGILI